MVRSPSAVLPDWMATADLALQIVAPATGPVLEARATVLRRGRTTLVIEAMVRNVAGPDAEPAGPVGDGSIAAWATMTFAVLPAAARTTTVGDLPDLPAGWSFTGAGLDRPVTEALGIEVDTTGRATVDVHEYLHNSFGAVQGGVMALLADVAAARAFDEPGGLGVVTDLQVGYLALGRAGPIVATPRVLRSNTHDGGRRHAVVELADAGADGRPTTVVNVGGTVVPR